MGSSLIKIAVNPRPFKHACGFYLYDRVFYPVALEVNDQRGDYLYRYAWRYGLKSGDLAYHIVHPNRRIFVHVLGAMGFKDVLESDLEQGKIVLEGDEDRHSLVFIRGKIFDNWATTLYVDEGVMHPLETTRYRSVYPNPRTGELNHVKASIKFKGKNYGDVLFPSNASDVEILTRAVKKIGFVFHNDSRIKRGFFHVADTKHKILVFRQHAK